MKCDRNLVRRVGLASVLILASWTDAGAADLAIVAGPSPLEKHAAEEFAKYAGQMTGSPPVVQEQIQLQAGRESACVSVGQTSVLDELAKKGAIRLPADLGEEGFMVKSAKSDGVGYLVIVGGSPKATLYAVYDYLERECKVGFFPDGEQIPRLKQIPVEAVDYLQKPRFPLREYMMDCEYTSYWWNWDDWKKELDWAAKRKFNLLSSNFDFTATWRRTWKRFGVDVPASSLTPPPFHPWGGWHKWNMRPPYPVDFQEFERELCQKFTNYGRSLGLKMAPDYRGFLGQVPEEFYQAYRDKAKFIQVRWVGFEPPGRFIHPSDPLYADLWKAYLKEYIDAFGTDHFYSGMTFSEMVPGDTPEDQEIIKTMNAKRAAEVIRSVDPKGVAFSSSWTWLDKKLWPKESVKAYMDTFPDDGILIWEQWNDFTHSHGATPMYKDLDHYFGKPWLLGFLHSYGGTTTLHGDLAGLIRRVKDVAADPQAGNCRGINLQPEALRHDFAFFDLLSRLGWNPAGIELESYLQDYATRRYGTAAAPGMVSALKELSASVLGTDDITTPMYQTRITEKSIESRRRPGPRVLSLSERARFVPHLRTALELACEQSSRLAESPLYQHDVIDITRQFLGDLFDVEMSRLYDRFQAGDRRAFEQQAAVVTGILDSQEKLLSSSDDFCLAPILQKARALPGAPPNFEELIRDILTVWANQIQDYARRDYYELVRFYYRPRVDAFIDHLRKKMAGATSGVEEQDLVAKYHEIEQRWVKSGFRVQKSDRFAGPPSDAATTVLKKHGRV